MKRQMETIQDTFRFAYSWGRKGVDRGEFRWPACIAVSPNSGSVYVTDMVNHRVQCFCPAGSFLCQWGSRGNAQGEMDVPDGIAIGQNQSLLREVKRVVELATVFPPGLLLICAAYIEDELVYVCDWRNNRAQVFEGDGKFVRIIKNEALCGPRRCAVSMDGIVYITSDSSSISVFSFEGTFLGSLVLPPLTNIGNNPQSIAIDRRKQLLYITDGTPEITVLQLDGTFVRRFGHRKDCVPRDVTVSNKNGDVYVRYGIFPLCISAYQTNGTLLRDWENSGHPLPDTLSSPSGIAVGPENQLYVVDHGIHCVYVFF